MAFLPLLSQFSLNSNLANRLHYSLIQRKHYVERNNEELFLHWLQIQQQIQAASVLSSFRLQQREVWTFPRSDYWWEQIVKKEWGDLKWKENFRMKRATFDFIVEKLSFELEKRNTPLRGAVAVDKRVGIALWRLATGNDYRSIAHLFGAVISTTRDICNDFAYAVSAVLKPIVCICSNCSFRRISFFGILIKDLLSTERSFH